VSSHNSAEDHLAFLLGVLDGFLLGVSLGFFLSEFDAAGYFPVDGGGRANESDVLLEVLQAVALLLEEITLFQVLSVLVCSCHFYNYNKI